MKLSCSILLQLPAEALVQRKELLHCQSLVRRTADLLSVQEQQQEINWSAQIAGHNPSMQALKCYQNFSVMLQRREDVHTGCLPACVTGMQEQQQKKDSVQAVDCHKSVSVMLCREDDRIGWPTVCMTGVQEQQQKRDRSAQIADHRRSMQALDRCNLCFGSAARQRHLTISLGQTAYLALPAK